MALSLNDKKVKRSALGEVKQHLPKKTAVMPWQEVQKSRDSLTGAGPEDDHQDGFNSIDNLGQTEAKVRPKLGRDADESIPTMQGTNLGQSEAKVGPKLGQCADEATPIADAANLGQSEAKLRPKLGQDTSEPEANADRTNLGQTEAKVRSKLGQAVAEPASGASAVNSGQSEAKVRPKLGQSFDHAKSGTVGNNLVGTEAKVRPKLGQGIAQPPPPGIPDLDLGKTEAKVRPKLGQSVTEPSADASTSNLGQTKVKVRPKLGHGADKLKSEDMLIVLAGSLDQIEAKVRPKLGQHSDHSNSAAVPEDAVQTEAKVRPKLGRHSDHSVPEDGVQTEAKVRPKLGQKDLPDHPAAEETMGDEEPARKSESQAHTSQLNASGSIDYQNLGQSEALDSRKTTSPKTPLRSLTADQRIAGGEDTVASGSQIRSGASAANNDADKFSVRTATTFSDPGLRSTAAELQQTPVKNREGQFSHLVGLQRSILMHLCHAAGASANRQTPPLTIAGVTEAVNTTAYGARKAIQRLEMKSLLCRVEFKDGRGGWTRYEIQKDAWDEIKGLELNLGQSEAKPESK